MNETNPHDRLAQLIADELLGQLSPEDRAELEALRAEHGDTGSADDYLVGEMLVAFDEASDDNDEMPTDLKEQLEFTGRGVVGCRGTAGQIKPRKAALPWALAAASIALVGVVSYFSVNAVNQRDQDLKLSQDQLASLQQQIETNRTTLADARLAQSRLQIELAEAAQQSIDLADRLAQVTSDLDDAKLEIARYEAPVDPEEMKANRRRLLEVPDTIRVAWQPFDLPDAPAEQPGVQGDVVWNNERQQGFLRFQGLAVNDPDVEQYQVWVIDERGMEQKVSGGVFNATADGELIVPIEPGIDVGKVAVFAITVENPGGTWVPDLQRRVVIAPTSEG